MDDRDFGPSDVAVFVLDVVQPGIAQEHDIDFPAAETSLYPGF
jgi:hypothetical protein